MPLAVVPARGGSKGIPRKNVKDFLGRPLLAWTVDAALQSGVCDRVVVSTDDEEIAEIARSCGAEIVLRPQALARDDTPTAPAVKHAIDTLGATTDGVLVLEPTSPTRRPEHIREVAELLASSGADSVASVSEVPHHYVAEKQLVLAEDGALAGLDGRTLGSMTHRRQDLPVRYALNGLVFACRSALLEPEPPTLWGERVLGFVVQPRYVVDLDTPDDWAAAEARLREILALETR